MTTTVSGHIASLAGMASALEPGNERQRLELLASARALVSQLEKPHEKIMRMIYHEPALFMATKVLADLKIFNLLATATTPIPATELASKTGADPRLVERLLKHVATENFVEETGPDTYLANDVTRCCATSGAKGAIDDIYQMLPVAGAVPEFLKDSGYANPTNKNKTAWQLAYKTNQHFFEYVNAPGREAKLEALRNHMDFKTVGLRWFEVPKLMSAIFSDVRVQPDDVLVVDVGGSGGHDLLAYETAQPAGPGRLILQDLPTTIDSLDADMFAQHRIEIMGHDFFTPQPVKAAKVYYLKMCLHDWPDAECSKILANLRLSMTPGYSRIILDEIIIPDENAGWFETSVDLLMMEVHSAQERREREWKALVNGVPGLRVKQIWDLEGSVNKVIEVEAI